MDIASLINISIKFYRYAPIEYKFINFYLAGKGFIFKYSL